MYFCQEKSQEIEKKVLRHRLRARRKKHTVVSATRSFSSHIQIQLTKKTSCDWSEECNLVWCRREKHIMIAIALFLGLVLTTVFAASAAVLLDWILLRAMFQLMRPATAKVRGATRSNFS